MLREVIEHVQKTAQPVILHDDMGNDFCVNLNGDVSQIHSDIFYPKTLELNSLDALVKMVKTEATNMESPLYITIPTHMKVICYGQPRKNERFLRQLYYEANATDVPGWEEKVSMDFEEAQVAMRTRFQNTEDVLYLQKLLSEISMGSKVTRNDNGVATTIVTKKGIDMQQQSTIRPILTLRPYRTFQEVDQPESTFLIRVDERAIRFIGADGGMWKLKARQTIKEFLEANLSAEVESGAVVIAL